MPPRLKIAAMVALAALLVLAIYWGIHRHQRGRLRAIDAIPADAFLVMTFDIDGLRRSPLGSPLFGGAAGRLVGEKTLTQLCGFDPLARMNEVAVAVPEKGEPGEFGIVVRAEISRDELIRCAQTVIESRQASAASHPTIRQSGSYTLIEPEGADADPTHHLPTLAYRDGGPFLIARGPWLMTMIDAVEGRVPSLRKNDDHMSLRRDVGQASESSPKVAVVVTALVPGDLRERIRKDMGVELGVQGGGREAEVMSGVLGVSAAGLGVTAGPAGGDSEVTAVARCEQPAQCAEVEKLVDKKRIDWSRDFAVRLLGMGPLIDALKVENRGTSLYVSSQAPSSEAAKWLERVLEVRGLRHPMPTASASPSLAPQPFGPPPSAPLSADEVVRPGAAVDGGAADSGRLAVDAGRNSP